MIVEGQGDGIAVPSLITRILVDHHAYFSAILPKPPMKVSRSRFASKFDDFERALRLLAPASDAIVVIIDSDDDDPDELRRGLESRASITAGHLPVIIAPAVKEYEAWLLASVPEMAGLAGVSPDATAPNDPESVRDAKGAFRHCLADRRYSESVDQKRYTSLIDVARAAERSPSFRRLVDALARLVDSPPYPGSDLPGETRPEKAT